MIYHLHSTWVLSLCMYMYFFFNYVYIICVCVCVCKFVISRCQIWQQGDQPSQKPFRLARITHSVFLLLNSLSLCLYKLFMIFRLCLYVLSGCITVNCTLIHSSIILVTPFPKLLLVSFLTHNQCTKHTIVQWKDWPGDRSPSPIRQLVGNRVQASPVQHLQHFPPQYI